MRPAKHFCPKKNLGFTWPASLCIHVCTVPLYFCTCVFVSGILYLCICICAQFVNYAAGSIIICSYRLADLASGSEVATVFLCFCNFLWFSFCFAAIVFRHHIMEYKVFAINAMHNVKQQASGQLVCCQGEISVAFNVDKTMIKFSLLKEHLSESAISK